MIARLVIGPLFAVLAQACSSVQQILPPVAPPPQPVVFIVHDSAAASNSKYLPNIRPNGAAKMVASLPWVAEYRAPVVYAEWWKEIAGCLKLEIPPELARKVRWIAVNSNTFRRSSFSEVLYGLTDPAGITIFVAQSKVLAKEVVEHEMAHMGNSWNGVDEGTDFHPYDSFETCGLHVGYP